MSLAQPSASTTIYACPQCGVDGVFGYLNKDGDLIWYCADHRLGRFWADARRDVVEPTPPASSGQPDQQHPPPLERFEHYCWCGKWGSFGYGVNLRNGAEGNWFCRLHRPGRKNDSSNVFVSADACVRRCGRQIQRIENLTKQVSSLHADSSSFFAEAADRGDG